MDDPNHHRDYDPADDGLHDPDAQYDQGAQPPELPEVPKAARVVGGFMGIIPLGIGLTVLGFLWGTPFNEFGSPPLFFRIFGSFIALAFVGTGVMIIIGAAKGGHAMRSMQRMQRRQRRYGAPPSRSTSATGAGYRCKHCGAPLAEGADVSPHGDVKCTYCECWFNIHG